MDAAITKLVDKILEHGLAGAIIIALMVAVGFLWRELRACRVSHNEIIRVAERNTAALNTLIARDEARYALNAEMKAAIIAQTQESRALHNYIEQREIARRT